MILKSFEFKEFEFKDKGALQRPAISGVRGDARSPRLRMYIRLCSLLEDTLGVLTYFPGPAVPSGFVNFQILFPHSRALHVRSISAFEHYTSAGKTRHLL